MHSPARNLSVALAGFVLLSVTTYSADRADARSLVTPVVSGHVARQAARRAIAGGQVTYSRITQSKDWQVFVRKSDQLDVVTVGGADGQVVKISKVIGRADGPARHNERKSESREIMRVDNVALQAVGGGHVTSLNPKIYAGVPVWAVGITNGGRRFVVQVNQSTYQVVSETTGQGKLQP